MKRRPVRALALPVLALASVAAAAQPLRGHIKGQQEYLIAPADSLANSLVGGDARATSLDLRLIGQWSKGHLSFDADYVIEAAAGSAVELQNRLDAVAPELFIDRAAANWLPLDDDLTDDGRRRARQSLDRFSLSYTTESWVFKLGRQAYTWGNGIVFKPFDLFDPFSPDVIDDSYKPGIDAVYTQRLFKDGSDVVALIVPRRDVQTGRVSSAASSAAIKWHRFGTNLQTDWLIARDYRDIVAGLGISGSLGEAVWRLSLVPVWLDAGGTRTSLVVNFEHAWQWRARNVSGFVEYFRNGFGRADRDYALDELESPLMARLARGQTFNTGRDYLAGGLRMELTPLLQVDPVLVLNARDRSALVLLRGSYSIAQDFSLDFGFQSGAGPAGTEFGGLATSAGGATFDSPPERIYARLAYYF